MYVPSKQVPFSELSYCRSKNKPHTAVRICSFHSALNYIFIQQSIYCSLGTSEQMAKVNFGFCFSFMQKLWNKPKPILLKFLHF